LKNKVIIIAEAGVNHNGDLDKALQLIDAAAFSGVDYVKFQTFKAKNLVQKSAKKAEYQTANTKDGDSQYEMLRKLEIPKEWYKILIERSKEKKIKFLSTGFDEESIDFLDNIGCDFYKIPSGEITNKPYLEHIASKGKPIIISTGMSDLLDIQNAINVFTQNGTQLSDITVLHCNTMYPTPMEDVNLKAMQTIADTFKVNIGYSDHTLGIEVAVAAVALGATVIEKHFTLDRNLPGPDHLASLIPEELTAMTSSIRNIEMAISGTGKKEPTNSEKINLSAARKSIHLKSDIAKGETINKSDLVMLRPGDGISPMDIESVINKKAINNLSQWSQVKLSDIE
tara:strand:+ start:5859 stop:6881 length:1023 start_codon:yes stop_codon:yes gene_type:complete